MVENGVPHEMVCAEHTLTDGKRSDWPRSLGLEDGKGVEKSTHIGLGEVVVL